MFCLFKSLLKSIKVLSAFLVLVFFVFDHLPTALCCLGSGWFKMGERDRLLGKDIGMAADNRRGNEQEKDNDDENIIKQIRMKASGIMQKRQQ